MDANFAPNRRNIQSRQLRSGGGVQDANISQTRAKAARSRRFCREKEGAPAKGLVRAESSGSVTCTLFLLQDSVSSRMVRVQDIVGVDPRCGFSVKNKLLKPIRRRSPFDCILAAIPFTDFFSWACSSRSGLRNALLPHPVKTLLLLASVRWCGPGPAFHRTRP